VLEAAELGPHYRIDVRRDAALDVLCVTVEPCPGVEPTVCSRGCSRLARRIKDRLGVSADVVLAAPGALPRLRGQGQAGVRPPALTPSRRSDSPGWADSRLPLVHHHVSPLLHTPLPIVGSRSRSLGYRGRTRRAVEPGPNMGSK